MKPLISVIIPTYNAQEYIDKCLDSIINQTYKNLEIIVINDGSIDESECIIRKKQEEDERIILLNQKNSGVSCARNNGIRKAHGDYIVFLDADDYVDIDYIEILYNCIKSTKSDVSICKFVINNGTYNDTMETKIYDSKSAIIHMLLAKKFDSSVCCKIIKSEFAKRELFSNELVIAEDMIYYYKIFEKCNKISYIDKTCYHYMQNENGAISNVSNIKVDNLTVFNNLILNCNDKDIKEALCSKYVSTCFHLLSLDVSNLSVSRVNALKDTIKKYRFRLLFKKNVKFKVRIACILSLFGFSTVNFIMKLRKDF